MIRRDVLSDLLAKSNNARSNARSNARTDLAYDARRAGNARNASNGVQASDNGDREPAGSRNTDMHIELDSADHEEPTWEVRHPNDPRPRRIDGRTRTILAIAAVAAVVVNAGAAWTYWQITGSRTSQAESGDSVSMALRARSDLNKPLGAGQTGDLVVTVTNGYPFPIRIIGLTPGVGNIVADDEHRDAGCTVAGVSITRPRFDVSWDVRRNTIGAFTVPSALTMSPRAAKACTGATFTVPVRVYGVRKDLA
jgi:hypothetical protein